MSLTWSTDTGAAKLEIWTGSHGSEVRYPRRCNGLKRIRALPFGCKPLALSLPSSSFIFFALFQFRRTRSHEEIDRTRRAQGLALVLVPLLISFKPKIEAAIIQESKLEPPDEVLQRLDQLHVLGIAGGLILQMVATLQANQRAERSLNENETDRSIYSSIARQRLDGALSDCEDAIDALVKLTRMRTA
jgi:hypothetical protein